MSSKPHRISSRNAQRKFSGAGSERQMKIGTASLVIVQMNVTQSLAPGFENLACGIYGTLRLAWPISRCNPSLGIGVSNSAIVGAVEFAG